MPDPATNQPPEYTHKVRYVIILVVLFALIISVIVIRGVSRSVDNTTAPTQKTNNVASPDATKATGAPTTDTNTPSDRTRPSPSGGDANTLLNPDTAQ